MLGLLWGRGIPLTPPEAKTKVVLHPGTICIRPKHFYEIGTTEKWLQKLTDPDEKERSQAAYVLGRRDGSKERGRLGFR